MNFRKPFFAIALSAALGLGAFGYSIASEKGGHHSEKGGHHSEKDHHPHWAYEGEHGPAHWGHMEPGFAACSEGKHQSPIDISAPQKEDLTDIGFSYKPSALNIINNGHTVQVNYDQGSSIKVNGADYQLAQFHFHTPSEHTLGGKSFGMELHLVHKNDKGELAVVGVLLEEGAENPAYKTIWKNLPKKADEKKTVKASVNADELLPKARSFYTYSGSLTTPPCSESVTWLVLKTPVQMSRAQIKAIESIMKHNNRPVQPLNDRHLKEDM